MVQRVTLRRTTPWNTRANKIKQVRTPGNKLIVHYHAKVAKSPSCGDCGCKIQGVPVLRPTEYSRIKPHERSVSRAYGGVNCSSCTRGRIVRAFLYEEQKIVKKVWKAQQKQNKIAERKAERAQKSKK